MGFLIVFLLSALVAGASLAAARPVWGVGPGTRTPTVVTAGVVAHVIIVVAVYFLGLAGILSVASLAGAALVMCGAILGLVAWREGGWRPFAEGTRAQLRGLAAWPRDLIRACRHAGMPLWPIVIFTGIAVAWLFLAAFVTPATGNNDALFYHEPIVGFTIQHGNLGPVDLPRHLQRINGMPRFCHFVQLWFAIFSGRDLVELPNILSHAMGVLGTFGLLRRLGTQKSTAIAWALLWAITPGIYRLSSGVMVDTHTGALVMAAAYLVLAPRRLTGPQALWAAAAVGLTVGTKYHVIVTSFVLAVCLLVRLIAARGQWAPTRYAALVTSCASIIFGALAAHYLRNQLVFDNPIWPAGLQIPQLGIHLKSADDLKNAIVGNKGLPAGEVIDRWFTPPFAKSPWKGGSARPEDYGAAGRYFIWPLAAWATLLVLGRTGRDLVRRRPISQRQWVMVAVAVNILVAVLTYASIVRGRYFVPVFGLLIVGAAWPLNAPRWRQRHRQIVFIATLLMMISLTWSYKHWFIQRPTEVWARLQVPYAEWQWTKRQLTSITPEAGRAREKEMTEGKVVGFDSGYSIGLLWNNDYSNDVVWVGYRQPIKRAEELDVDWLFLWRRTFQGEGWDTAGWEYIGKVVDRRNKPPGGMYRRVKEPTD